MFKDTDSFASGIVSLKISNGCHERVAIDTLFAGELQATDVHALSPLMVNYLDRLNLTTEQRSFVESSMHADALAGSTLPVFAALESALGALSDGDALNTRLILSVPSAASHDRPDRWLRNQVAPKINRASMASRYFVRSPKDVWSLFTANIKKITSGLYTHRKTATGQYYFP
jgi:hypothetical protein